MKLKIATACLFATLAQAPHARATEGTVTYFGVVNNTQTLYGRTDTAPDYDVADLFGGGNLDGDFIVATFTYNSAFGFEESDPGVSEELLGGRSFTSGSPLISASFSIETPSTSANTSVIYNYTFTPDYSSSAYAGGTGLEETGQSIAGDGFDTYIWPDAAGPTSLAQSFNSTGYGPGSDFLPGGTNTGQLDAIVFDTLDVTVTATPTVSAAPEPGAWTLMVFGLGAVGMGLRYSRARRSSSAGLPA
jgi:hypothetical protein